MPDLKYSLGGHDLGHLQIVAEHWGLEVQGPDAQAVLPVLVEGMLDGELVAEIFESLSDEANAALGAIVQNDGRMTWALFIRRYGAVREMGPGRRDRERPDRSPVSAAEVLWYRGLIARAFFDSPTGSQEYAYIPDDLITLLPAPEHGTSTQTPKTGIESAITLPLGRPATPKERANTIPASDSIVDHACTLLAALRIGLDSFSEDELALHLGEMPGAFLSPLLRTAGLVDANDSPDIEATRGFVEATRGEALSYLFQSWRASPTHNDLRLMPDLRAEGEWENEPLRTRRTVLDWVTAAPSDTWWSVSALVADVRQASPDFQRPAGDYDSWFLRDEDTGEYLRGVTHWDDVDGALIRYLIDGPMHWLGLLDLALPEEDGPVTAFRLSRWAVELLGGESPKGLADEDKPAHLRSDGLLGVPRLAPRAVRYQLARFCHWEAAAHEYRYRLTPASLTRAGQQGLRISHLLALLQRHVDRIPPNILTALKRWDEVGTEARLEEVMILRLSSPALLKKLRSSRAARFLGDPLGPTTVVVKPGAGEKVLAVLVEMGYLGEVSLE
jgi:hypothetical protein